MTIASEISRLQTDKECIRQAIIGKGVDVAASVSLDDYAACIDAIQGLPTERYVKYLLVGGGGGAAQGGGGGGGEVLFGEIGVYNTTFNVVVGCGGNGNNDGGDTNFDVILARGGKHGVLCTGGASGNGCLGGNPASYCSGGGGGGAGGAGCDGGGYSGGNGGAGICGYGGGGGGYSYCPNSRGNPGQGVDGGGNGGKGYSSTGDAATNCGGGSGGGGYGGHGGAGGLAEICYKTDGSCGIIAATGGNCCFICDGYKVHRFTSNGTFTIVS